MILEANILSKLQNKAQLARELGISRGVLYRDHKMPKKDLEIANKIRQVQELHPSYGYRRIALTLKINHKRALRVMQLFDLKSKRKTKIYKKVEKNLNEDLNKIEYKNLIINKKITKPNQVWSADFTYLPSDNKNHKFIFLATVIDCYTREILGFELSVKLNRPHFLNNHYPSIYQRNQFLFLCKIIKKNSF
jgi:transposase InsO family protein